MKAPILAWEIELGRDAESRILNSDKPKVSRPKPAQRGETGRAPRS